MKHPTHVSVDANGLRWKAGNRYNESAIPPEHIRVCREFLTQCQRTKRGRIDSYHLKHVIERWDYNRGGVGYVCNGACIQAALDLGIAAEPIFGGYSMALRLAGAADGGRFENPRPLSAYIGVSKRSVRTVADQYPEAKR